MITAALGWVPFITPLHALQPIWWLSLLPLAFGIAIVHKSLRAGRFDRFWREVLVATIWIVGGVVGLGIVFAILVEWLIPMVPVG